jgi:hypothetical protein
MTPKLHIDRLQKYKPFHLLKVVEIRRIISRELKRARPTERVTMTESALYWLLKEFLFTAWAKWWEDLLVKAGRAMSAVFVGSRHDGVMEVVLQRQLLSRS